MRSEGKRSPKARTITRKIYKVPQNKGKGERFKLPKKKKKSLPLNEGTQLTNT